MSHAVKPQRSTANVKTYGIYDNAVSAYIDEFWRKNFRSPTIREIARGCHITSTAAARNTIERVARRRGDTVLKDGTSRGIIPRWVIHAIKKYDIETQHLTKPINPKAIYP